MIELGHVGCTRNKNCLTVLLGQGARENWGLCSALEDIIKMVITG